MSETPRQLGFAFALPRLLARFAGRRVKAAQFSGAEAWSLGLLVYLVWWVLLARLLLPLVRTVTLQLLLTLAIPPAIWIGFLLLYYLNALGSAAARRLGLYSAPTNNPFQHLVIMSLTSLLALLLLRDACAWVRSLGVFWLVLLALNLLAIPLEKWLDRN